MVNVNDKENIKYKTNQLCTSSPRASLEFEDGVAILFRELPKNGWESIYRIYISNDEDLIEKNRIVYDEDIEGYVLQNNN